MHHAQCETVPERKRKRAGIAPRRLENNLQIGSIEFRPRAHKGIGFENVAGQWPAAKQRVFQECPQPARRSLERDAIRLAVAHLHENAGGQVIVIVGAHARQGVLDLDSEIAQRICVTDTGQHQDLWRLNGSGADDDFAPGVQPLGDAVALALDPGRAPVLDDDARHQRVGEHLEIAARTRRA